MAITPKALRDAIIATLTAQFAAKGLAVIKPAGASTQTGAL